MFKKERHIWWHLLGIIAMFVLLFILPKDIFFKLLRGEIILRFYNYPPAFEIEKSIQYNATFNTSMGNFKVKLFAKNAPNNVNNFIHLARTNYYNKTKFHRLINNILVQGGDRNTLDSDPNNDGLGYPGYIINDEISKEIKLKKYSLAMANSGKDTNGSQFFIITGDDSKVSKMNGSYTIIGEVVDGAQVINKINEMKTIIVNNYTAPETDIILNSVTITQDQVLQAI